jgi:hypothetical protein
MSARLVRRLPSLPADYCERIGQSANDLESSLSDLRKMATIAAEFIGEDSELATFAVNQTEKMAKALVAEFSEICAKAARRA